MIFMMKVSLSLIFCFFVVKSKAGGDYTVDRNDFSYSREEDITPYKPEWTSLDNRPSPKWYDDAKIGIFLHWGVYAVPGFGSEWFWSNWKEETSSTKYRDFMKERYPPKFTYQEFAKDFTAEFFNATQWAEIFDAAGAKYVVLTSKHHEGYTLWPSKYSFSWNSMDVGPNRDLIGELSTAIRKNTNIKFGLYHSLYEWYNPLYLRDKANAFETNEFSTQKVYPEMIELVEKYQPEIFWSDGEWDAPDTYWKSKEFLAWLFNDSPVSATVVVNDRWGKDTLCRHGGFYTCTDRYNPGHLITHKWENAMTIDRKSWGFRRNAPLEDYFSIKELVKELASTVSCGGNLLMNVGPTKDGIIAPIFEDRLRELGKWLKVNGEAIYKTKPWIFQNDTITGDVWYTISNDEQSLYAIMLSWPEDDILKLGAIPPTPSLKFKFLGYTNILEWEKATKGVSVNLPPRVNRGQPGWAIKITTPKKYTQILSKEDIYLSEN